MIKKICVLLLAAGMLISCGKKEEKKEEVKRRLPDVSAVPLKAETLDETFILPASVEAWEDVVLSAETAGRITEIRIKEGETVKKGQTLIKINTDSLEGSYRAAKAVYDQTKKDLERVKKLYQGKAVGKKSLDDASSAFRQASANLSVARAELSKGVLKSTINGIADRIPVDAGEYVNPGATVARVVDISKLKAIVYLPEKDAVSVKSGQDVAVMTGELNRADKTFAGKILHVASSAEDATRTYRTKIEITGAEKDLKPGMIVRVLFRRAVHENVIAIPLYSIVDMGTYRAAFVLKGDEAKMVRLTFGPVLGAKVIVTSGLNEGDMLIVKGHQLLTDGTKVHPVK